MSRKNWRDELETGMTELIRSYLYGRELRNSCENLSYQLQEDGRGRHNYQRDYIRATAKLKLIYNGNTFAVVDKVKKEVGLIQLEPTDTKLTYFAQKMLEKLLYYDFLDLKVIK